MSDLTVQTCWNLWHQHASPEQIVAVDGILSKAAAREQELPLHMHEGQPLPPGFCSHPSWSGPPLLAGLTLDALVHALRSAFPEWLPCLSSYAPPDGQGSLYRFMQYMDTDFLGPDASKHTIQAMLSSQKPVQAVLPTLSGSFCQLVYTHSLPFLPCPHMEIVDLQPTWSLLAAVQGDLKPIMGALQGRYVIPPSLLLPLAGQKPPSFNIRFLPPFATFPSLQSSGGSRIPPLSSNGVIPQTAFPEIAAEMQRAAKEMADLTQDIERFKAELNELRQRRTDTEQPLASWLPDAQTSAFPPSFRDILADVERSLLLRCK